MKLYSIINSKTPRTNKLLEEACQEHNVEYIAIEPEKFSFDDSAPKLSKNDSLYRALDSRQAQSVEKFLLNPEVTSFYSDPSKLPVIDSTSDSLIIHRQHNIPMPKTIFGTPSNPEAIKRAVKYLNGFPIIVKAMGGCHGIGVMKADSLSSLLSITDYLSSKNEDTVMREFIDTGQPPSSYRAIILDNEVKIAYQSTLTNADDFRSNRGQKKTKVAVIKLTAEQNKDLVKAVTVLGYEFGGADFVIDKDGNLKIFEINFPINMPTVVKKLGYNIHEEMIKYLLKKASS